MKATVLVTAILSLCLAGCVASAAKVAKAPVPPVPPAAPVPISIPQTRVELPEYQPVDPAALEKEDAPPPTVSAPTTPAPTRTATPARPKPQPAREAQPPAVQPPPQPAAPPAGPPAETPRPEIQELISPVEAKRLQESAVARRTEASHILQQIDPRRLNHSQQEVVANVRNFLTLSENAEKQNDLHQADALAERAQVLAKELQSGK